jgi:hypothetical protein
LGKELSFFFNGHGCIPATAPCILARVILTANFVSMAKNRAATDAQSVSDAIRIKTMFSDQENR